MGMGVLLALFLDPIVILAALWVLFRGATLKGLILIVWLASGFKGILLLTNDSLSSNEWGFLLIASAISTLIMCLFAQWIRKLFSRKSVNRSVSADEPSVARDDTVHDALN